ncbi:MAG: SufD family Fe-S cluster assembly protein [Thermodesulfovibrionales bacterium]|nr:SufD family Fe-S cluster assembly protein [Thermodesulfovibrionales bacterium]
MRTLKHEKKAAGALKKPAALGPDIDIGSYGRDAPVHKNIENMDELQPATLERARAVGIEGSDTCRSGSFFQSDHTVMLARSMHEGLELMDIEEAMDTHDWLDDYIWKAVRVDADKYTAEAALRPDHGYFIRALAGARVEMPLQACLYMSGEGLAQNVHNIIIAEEGSELHIITGCTTADGMRGGLHIGVSEFYIKRGARLTFTMIHNWAPDMAVRPRSVAIVEEDGLFLSTYVCMNPVRTLQLYPTAFCTGPGATVRFGSVLVAQEGTSMDVGSKAVLEAPGAKAEIVSRAITRGGEITVRGHLVGQSPGVKGHLECRGLILSDKGTINAVPLLDGKAPEIELSHEAAVGKIAEEELNYLTARGLSPEEATSAIVTGFLDIDMPELPEGLAKEMKKAVRLGDSSAL